MKIVLTILVLAADGLYQVSGQRELCYYADNYQTYSLCKSGQLTCNVGGCSSIQPQCPYGASYSNGQCTENFGVTCPASSVLDNGRCVYQQTAQCPIGSTNNNNVCVYANPAPCPTGFPTCNSLSSSCQQPNCQNQICQKNQILIGDKCAPTTVATCPLNWSLRNGICYHDQICNAGDTSCNQGTVTNCPQGYTLINGSCVTAKINCSGNSFPLNGQCVACPPNSMFINGVCSSCAPGMTQNIDGTCECPSGTVWSYGRCVATKSRCGQDEKLINEICMKCYNGQCCKSILCNDCFLSCGQFNDTVNPVSACRMSCLKNELPFETESFSRIISNKSSDTSSKNSANINPTVYIMNIVNSTNTHNVVTNINNTNVNNINLGSESKSENTQTSSEVIDSSEDDEDYKLCCIIIEPQTCSQRVDKKWECNERRQHVCDMQCMYREYAPETPLETPQQPILQPYPVYMPVLQPQINQMPIPNIPQPRVVVVAQPQPTYGFVQQQRQGCEVQEQWPFLSCPSNIRTSCQQCVGPRCSVVCS